MPRFYFDMHTATQILRDADGLELKDAASALRGCIAGIEDGLTDGVERVVIRDEAGQEIAWIKVDALRRGSQPGPQP